MIVGSACLLDQNSVYCQPEKNDNNKRELSVYNMPYTCMCILLCEMNCPLGQSLLCCTSQQNLQREKGWLRGGLVAQFPRHV